MSRSRPTTKRLQRLQPEEWPTCDNLWRAEVWQSRDLLVQLYTENPEALRIAVRSARKLAWDELMAIKRTIGRGDTWAVEIFPADAEIVDLEDIRHLWLLPRPPRFAWRTKPENDKRS